jgi:hypothetical protein
MSGPSRFHDGGAFCKAVPLAVISLTAGGTGDNTEAISSYIDVRGYCSAKLVLMAKSSITAAKVLNVTAALKDATDTSGTGAAAYGSGVTSKQMDAGAVTNNLTVMELDYDLAGCRGFIASDITPDLTASGTDTSTINVLLILFGAAEQPSTARAN